MAAISILKCDYKEEAISFICFISFYKRVYFSRKTLLVYKKVLIFSHSTSKEVDFLFDNTLFEQYSEFLNSLPSRSLFQSFFIYFRVTLTTYVKKRLL